MAPPEDNKGKQKLDDIASASGQHPPEKKDESEFQKGSDDESSSSSAREDRQNAKRLSTLAKLLRQERTALKVTNMGLERGRPILQPAADMRGDPTNLYNRCTTDFLHSLMPKKVSNNIATAEEMVKIQVAIEGLGVPTDQIANVILQLVIRCVHTSSSSFQDPKGTFEWPGGAIISDDVVGVINELSTLRKVCRLYAPVAWNYMHIHDEPPSDWAAMGFHYTTRFAAFDFFDYVQNGAAIKPLGGIVPMPTRAEYVAYNTYKQLAIDRANNNDTYANLDSAVTGGRMGPEIQRNMNFANNKRQY
ncbi:coat protein [Phlox virus B]|uniref:Capsid protein n=1 Tax=Phlox virus B TaxID=475777 RepID=A8II66_9VIRU|nr:coat protein [Phlox virus B]ABW05096.1 coat protein [Phlox virus B]